MVMAKKKGAPVLWSAGILPAEKPLTVNAALETALVTIHEQKFAKSFAFGLRYLRHSKQY
jgi:hypothetical protein